MDLLTSLGAWMSRLGGPLGGTLGAAAVVAWVLPASTPSFLLWNLRTLVAPKGAYCLSVMLVGPFMWLKLLSAVRVALIVRLWGCDAN